MKTKTKIIIIGILAIAWVFAGHLLYEYQHQSQALKVARDTIEAIGKDDPEAVKAYTNWVHQAAKRYDHVQPPTRPEPEPIPSEPQTVTLYFNLKGTNETKMIAAMTKALWTPEHVPDERTIAALVMARVKADWSKVPKGTNWADNPHWQEYQARALKGKIARIMDTTDEVTIKRVLECDLDGVEIPPMSNFSLDEIQESQ